MTLINNIITIDGPAASGKGTLARKLADHLNYFYLDTGKIYRLVGLAAHEKGIEPADSPRDMEKIAQDLAKNFTLDMMDNPDLKSDLAGQTASKSGAVPQVRAAILNLQRHLAEDPPTGKNGSVLDGRDCGTVICPQARYKFFITADQEVRAKRRFEELKSRGDDVDYETVLEEMKIRDERDTTRATVPLKPAEDALIVDTTDLNIERAFEKILHEFKGCNE